MQVDTGMLGGMATQDRPHEPRKINLQRGHDVARGLAKLPESPRLTVTAKDPVAFGQRFFYFFVAGKFTGGFQAQSLDGLFLCAPEVTQSVLLNNPSRFVCNQRSPIIWPAI